MELSDIRGNDAVVGALRGMVDSGRIPHALLLHENDGGGAFPIVIAFLQYLYGPSGGGVGKLIHPDVHLQRPCWLPSSWHSYTTFQP